MVSLTMETGGHGDRCPCCAGGVSSTGDVVEKTVMLPQLHLLRNSLRAAHELRWRFFRALHTGTGPGSVSRGTRAHNKVHHWCSWRDMVVKSHHNHRNHWRATRRSLRFSSRTEFNSADRRADR